MKRVRANNRHSVITSQHLAKQMNISLEKDNQMMRVATQKGIRTARLAGKWYVDWISAGTKSLSQI